MFLNFPCSVKWIKSCFKYNLLLNHQDTYNSLVVVLKLTHVVSFSGLICIDFLWYPPVNRTLLQSSTQSKNTGNANLGKAWDLKWYHQLSLNIFYAMRWRNRKQTRAFHFSLSNIQQKAIETKICTCTYLSFHLNKIQIIV